jgi:transcriptional regulator with XRE-family HTH domain
MKKRSQKPALRAFGAWLQELRGEASRERISQKLAAKGVPLGGSTLAQYEKGAVWAPDAGVLWGLAQIYETDLDHDGGALAENRKRTDMHVDALRDLLRHKRDQASGAFQGGKV